MNILSLEGFQFLLKLDKRERVTSKAYFSVTFFCRSGVLQQRTRQHFEHTKGYATWAVDFETDGGEQAMSPRAGGNQT